MALRKILIIPDTRLRQVATPVTRFDEGLKTLVADMFETMYDAPGIGLAAPQIGVMERLIVVDCASGTHDEEAADPQDEDSGNGEGGEAIRNGAHEFSPDSDSELKSEPTPEPIAMINPEIVWFSDEFSVHEEGCLSIPDYYEDVERPARCAVKYFDPEGRMVERELQGLLSTCVQHEVDHLNGKLFIDYISRLKREMVTKKFKKAARHAAG